MITSIRMAGWWAALSTAGPARARWRRAWILIVAMVAAGQPAVAGEAVEGLKRVMAERLALMHEVARYKWNQGLAIEDPERERVVLARTAERAVAGGIPAALAARLVRAQIEAAKVIQRADVAGWEAAGAGPFDHVPDLAGELRPEITRRTDELIVAVRQAMPLLGDCPERAALRVPPPAMAAYPEAWAIAVAGLLDDDPAC